MAGPKLNDETMAPGVDMRAVRAEIARRGLAAPPPVWAPLARSGAIVAVYAALVWAGFRAGHPAVWAVVWAALGYILTGSGGAYHEAAHNSVFRSRRANRLFGIAWAAPTFVNFSLFRAFHLHHHRNTRFEIDGWVPGLAHSRALYLYVLVTVAWTEQLVAFLRASLAAAAGRRPAFATDTQLRDIRRDNVWLACALVLAAAGLVSAPWFTLAAWLIPVAVAYTFGISAIGLAEHYGLPQTPNVLKNSASHRASRAWSFVAWNNQWHTAHHLAPKVPYHAVAEVHALLGDVIDASETYAGFHRRIWRELRNNPPAPFSTVEAYRPPAG